MYDAIVVGAGPAGCVSALEMAGAGLKVLLVDKHRFPRDKICGDAISGKSVEVLERLGLIGKICDAGALPSWGITFGGPSGVEVSIPFSSNGDAGGYVCRRVDFDEVMYDAAVVSGAEIWQECEVKGLLRSGEQVTGVTVSRPDGTVTEVEAPVVIGADGAYSIVAKELGFDQLDDRHYVGALRAYYQGVSGFNDGNFIEIHFVDEILPGYFWIFPLSNGGANVGVGMLSGSIKKNEVRLRSLLDKLVEHPRFRDRFANAERIGKVKGWGLPLGSRPRKMAGNGWMLTGDAASLIDPFTGEGIGNALVSGAIAAEWVARANTEADYSSAFLQGYEREVMGALRDELQMSYLMQRIGRWRWLLDLVIRKAARSNELADTISCMFDQLDERRKLASPLFYLRVLTA